MKLHSQMMIIEYSEEKQALLITTQELEFRRPIPIKISVETLKGMEFSQSAEFVGERVLLAIPGLRELFGPFLWHGREPPKQVSSAETRPSEPVRVLTRISAITPAGEQVTAEVGVGHPYCLAEGRWRCETSLTPLYPAIPATPGRDAFQASCFAHDQLIDLLRLFVEKGGKLMRADGSDLDLDCYAVGQLRDVDPEQKGGDLRTS